MSNSDKHKPNPIWPPPIAALRIQKHSGNSDVWYSLKNIALFLVGVLCGSTLYAVCETLLFFMFVKLRVEQMLDGASHSSWLVAFYGGKIIELASLSIPVLSYIWLRRTYPSFAIGVLGGSGLIMVLFVKLFFIGI